MSELNMNLASLDFAIVRHPSRVGDFRVVGHGTSTRTSECRTRMETVTVVYAVSNDEPSRVLELDLNDITVIKLARTEREERVEALYNIIREQIAGLVGGPTPPRPLVKA